MKLVSRAAWGARSRSTSTNITPGNGGVSIHCVGASHINDSHGNCAGRVRGIQNFHINGNGWADIAYSLLVCSHGYVYVGRGINRRTAANGTNSGNQSWYAVCALIGGSQQPTAAMDQGIKDAVAYLRRSGGAASRVNGHRDHLATSCPGNPLYAKVRAGVYGSGGSGGGGGGGTTRSTTSIQNAVNGLGHTPPLKIDGVPGPLTTAGVRWLQARVGATVDGSWGPETERLYLAHLEEDDMPTRDRFTWSDREPRQLVQGEWVQMSYGARNGSTDGGPYFSFAGLSSSAMLYDLSAGWRITGLEPGAEYQTRLALYDPPAASGGSWTLSSGLRLQEHVHKLGDAFGVHTDKGRVDANRRVRLEIKILTDSPGARVVGGSADTFTWAE